MNDIIKKAAQCGKSITTFLSLCDLVDIDVKQCNNCGLLAMFDEDVCDRCNHNDFELLQ